MKKVLIFMLVGVSFVMSACGMRSVPTSFEDAQSVLDYMLEGNEIFVESLTNGGDISSQKRVDTAENGQHPYAVVITCSDSRTPAEHIFNAGIGEIFVIRTAGNVIGDYELGSVEYGAEHLETKLVLVMGHTDCGAVKAALSGEAHGNIEKITQEINSCLPPNCEAREAEKLNVQNSINKIMQSPTVQNLVTSGAVEIRGAIYDVTTGKVTILD